MKITKLPDFEYNIKVNMMELLTLEILLNRREQDADPYDPWDKLDDDEKEILKGLKQVSDEDYDNWRAENGEV